MRLRAADTFQRLLLAVIALLVIVLILAQLVTGRCSQTLVIAVLVIAVALYAALSTWRRSQRRRLGLEHGELVAADDSELTMPTLRSERLRLIGRPDHLIRSGRYIIPVEQKPRARRAQPSHVMQLAAQCLLVEDVYGVRPPYGLLVLADGVQERVTYSQDLEQRLLATIAQMRALLAQDDEPGARWLGAKCRACGFRSNCWN